MVINMDVDSTERYSHLKEIYIEMKENVFTAYPVAEYELNRNKTCTLRLEGVDSFEQAQPYLKKSVFLPLSFLPDLGERSFYFHEIPGYTVIDKTFGEVGIAESVIESAASQNILQVKQGRTEILLPLTPQFIIAIDRVKRTLTVDAPEGLIEMYLRKDADEEE